MGCDPRECHASTRLALSINVRLLYTRFCATAINTVTSQVRSMSVGLHTHSHAENITGRVHLDYMWSLYKPTASMSAAI